MELIKKKVSDLIPYINNSRTHSEEQITQLISSIKEFGFTNPILLAPDNSIIAGHGRLQAVKRLGHEEVPCIIVQGLTKTQIKALIIADNQLALNAGWDLEKLSVEVEGLKDEDFNIDVLGFEDEFLKDLLHKENLGLTDEDAVPEVKENPKSKLGDIFVLGNHRLMCGDAIIFTDVEKLMNNNKADMVFTDPPYGYEYVSNHQTKHEKLLNDDKIVDFALTCKNFMFDNSSIFVCGSFQTISKWIDYISKNFSYKNLIVWKKNNWSMGDLKGAFAGQHELIIFAHKGKVELLGKREPDIWNFDRVPPKMHPTQKPVELIIYAMSKVQSGIVLDLFGGSGSTLIACEKSNKINHTMELDPKYCDVIIQRWQQFTGKEAIHEQSGKTYNSI